MGRFVARDNRTSQYLSGGKCSIESLDTTINELTRDITAIHDSYWISSNESFDLAISMESMNDRVKATIQRLKEWIVKFIKYIAELVKKIANLATAKSARAKAKVKQAKESVANADNETVAKASKEIASKGISIRTRFAGDIK